MTRRLAPSSQGGFTIVELLVAMTVLAVGILGTVSLIDTSNANTSKTKAREGATNLGRAVMEIARAVPYKDLSPERVLDELENHAGLEDANTALAGHQIRSRNFTYTVAIGVCALDDAKDRLGTHDEAITFCSDSDVASAGATPLDRNPDDYRRVSVSISYKAPDTVTATTKQTGLITNPVGGLGPSVTSLRITAPVADNPTIETASGGTPASTASFSAVTSVSARDVQWSINGSPKGTATGSGVNWSFSWNLAETLPSGALRYPDCTYVVRAEAFDDKDRSGAAKALTIRLNRLRPVAPTGFGGGRNLNGDLVDLEWNSSRECDIEAYRVYRGTSPTAPLTDLVCETERATTDCIDDEAPAPTPGQTLYYEVAGVDIGPSGSREEGTRSARIAVLEGNNAPPTPPNLQACVGGNPGCNDIDGNPAPAGTVALRWDAVDDPDGDTIAFYRVYRGGNTYGDRLDVLFPVENKPLVFVDDNPAAGPNTYYVSAVDKQYGESPLVGSVTITP